MFEQGNQLARKPEDQLSQTQDAINGRKRHAAAKTKTEAERRRVAAASDAKRAAMVARFGEARVESWESGQMAGIVVFDLLDYFFGDVDVKTVTNDENVEDVINCLANLLAEYKPDPEMPRCNWDRFREWVGEAGRLGFDIDLTPDNCREFFGYYLKARRGEIVHNDLERRPWWPEKVSVQEILALEPPAKATIGQDHATKPPEPEPPASRPTFPVAIHDALMQRLAQADNHSGSTTK